MDWLAFWRKPRSIDVENVFRIWAAGKERRERQEGDEEREAKRARNDRITRVMARLLACVQAANGASHVLVLPNAVGVGNERECWKRDRRQNNFTELFDDRTTDETFKRLMRMTRACFWKLLEYVESDLVPSPYARGDFMSPCRILCLTILRLAHGTSFLELSQTFAIGVSTAHSCYRRGIYAILQLKKHFIRPLLTVDEINACIESFKERGFPNACLLWMGVMYRWSWQINMPGSKTSFVTRGFTRSTTLRMWTVEDSSVQFFVDGLGHLQMGAC